MLDEHFFGLYEKVVPDDVSWPKRLEIVQKAGFDYI